ncbi:MAG: Fic family protein [Oscillospiraceae bacterium]|jgi:Fic family protein|nr:Fic family protein [Oscillospiraceae bacterium]
MSYETLEKIFYQDRVHYEQEVIARRENPCAVHLPVSIHGNPAFYLNLPEVTDQLELITFTGLEIRELFDTLPEKAQERLCTKAMLQEILHTNEVEGIHSSRKELREAFDSSQRKQKKKPIKFEGLVRVYSQKQTHPELMIIGLESIREFYDIAILPDLEDKTLYPDGEIFRKEGVTVDDGLKIIHAGIVPEAELVEFMNAAFNYWSKSTYSIVNLAVFHYLFGYAHPFYDGNGRIGRLLCSLALHDIVHPLIGYKLATMIADSKSEYYKAFETCNNPKNRGDLTPFVCYFVKTVCKGARVVKEQLGITKKQYQFFLQLCNVLCEQKRIQDKEFDMITILLQVALFSDVGISIQGLSRATLKSVSTIQKRLQSLKQRGIPITTERDGKQYLYSLSIEELEKMAVTIAIP